MSAKKVILVIVEGPSDEDALGVIFQRFFDKSAVRIKVIHGDITTETNVNVANILSKITEIVKQSLGEYYLRKSDILQVIHVVDTGGAYIPNEAVVYEKEAEKPFYTTTEIKTSNPEKIIERNARKKMNLTRLHSSKYVWGSIPYNVFYMSSNLEHALYNELNLSDAEKERKALAFAKKYRDNISEFVKFVRESDFAVVDGYMSSWEFIKDGLHSLERHTNIGICFGDENHIELDKWRKL